MKLNGVKNAKIANVIHSDDYIDHCVCVFNRDGSEFDGIIKNNQTIIIDAWAGICDFANNIFKKYDTIFNLKNSGKYTLSNLENLELTNSQLSNFRSDFPNLIL